MQAPPDVQFFKPFLSEFGSQHIFQITARDYAETLGLLRTHNISYLTIGKLSTSSNFKKMCATLTRANKLNAHVGSFDACFTLGNLHSIYVAKLRRKMVVNFMDNELGLKGVTPRRTLYDFGVIKSQTLLADYIITPSVFPIDALVADGMKQQNIRVFPGYKEDIYLADYSANPAFLDMLPFRDFVVVRPESHAIYREKRPSLVPKLVHALEKLNINIVYLPRIQRDYALVKNGRNVFIPKTTLNGLDLCFYAQAVLSGSGTLTREAACMGNKSISFFPNNNLLAVDASLVKEGRLLHSRNIEEITQYLVYNERPALNLERCKHIKTEMCNILKELLDK